MLKFKVIILPLAECDIAGNTDMHEVYVLRILHMRVDAKPLLLSLMV